MSSLSLILARAFILRIFAHEKNTVTALTALEEEKTICQLVKNKIAPGIANHGIKENQLKNKWVNLQK